MSRELLALLFGALGTLAGAAIHFWFQRHSAALQERREIVEVHLLQLQNSLESLYYRMINLMERGGGSVMSNDYFRTTMLYILGRVLAHESLLISQGIYAKLNHDEQLKQKMKAGLHAINRAMDDQQFLHYHRVQLGEMLLQPGRVLTYTEFAELMDDDAYAKTVAAAAQFVEHATSDEFGELRDHAQKLITLLETRTKVPSALTLRAAELRSQLEAGAAP